MKKQSFWQAVSVALIFGALFSLSPSPTAKENERATESNSGKKRNTLIEQVNFTASAEALNDCLELDISSRQSDRFFDWIELLAYLAQKYNGDFTRYQKDDLDALLKEKTSEPRDVAKNKEQYDYYLRAYTAVLGGLVGEYTKEVYDQNGNAISRERKYGLMAYHPIAAGYYCSEFDDFGAERTYGYKRPHLGHDIVGATGTPIVAVEGGYVEALGWNRYGGWRVGIRSFDNQRYYYYAHLRKGHPYNELYEGKIVSAGEIIGYMGRTGYSTEEDTDNIVTPHLHIGMQLIFSPEQKDGENQIWIDFYQLSKFLSRNKATVYGSSASTDMFSNVKIIPYHFPD